MTAAELGEWIESWWWTPASEPGHASVWHLAPSSDPAPPSAGVTFSAPEPCTFTGTACDPSPDDLVAPHCLACQRFASALPPPRRELVKAAR